MKNVSNAPTEEETQVPDPAVAPSPSSVEEKIEAWFAKHFHNLGPLLDTRAYNLLHAAKEDLKAVLAKL